MSITDRPAAAENRREIKVVISCRRCQKKMPYVVLAGKTGAYLEAHCPSCGESYRYIDGDAGKHSYLITEDNPNATITKCILCGGYRETHWGDTVYADRSLQNERCPRSLS